MEGISGKGQRKHGPDKLHSDSVYNYEDKNIVLLKNEYFYVHLNITFK